MAAKDDIDVKIDENLKILQDDGQGNGSESVCWINQFQNRLRLRRKDGSLNEEARAKLVSNMIDIKEDREKRKAKSTEKQSKGNIKMPDSNGQCMDGWDITRTKRKVKVYMPIQTPAAKTIVADLSKFFETMSVECSFTYTFREVSNDASLIVVCPVLSRLEPDVDDALQGVKWPKRFAVVVLNMTRENSLPRLPVTTRLNTQQEKYKDIEFIDAAFTLEEHFYNCNMNIEAKNKIKTYIDTMYREQKNKICSKMYSSADE